MPIRRVSLPKSLFLCLVESSSAFSRHSHQPGRRITKKTIGVLSSCHSADAGVGSDTTTPLVTNLSAAVDKSDSVMVIIFLLAAAAEAMFALLVLEAESS